MTRPATLRARVALRRALAITLLILSLVFPAASRAATSGPEGLARRFDEHLAAGRHGAAAAVAESLVRARVAGGRLDPARAPRILDSLGARLFAAGSPQAWAAAESLFRAALARRERLYGAGHPEVASSLSTIATLLDYAGRWLEAVPLESRALEIRLRTRGERHAETASSLRHLGQLHFQLGAYDQATEPFARSVAIYRELGPAWDERLADGYNNLGELARVQDRLDSADAHFRAGLTIARERMPAGHRVRWVLTNNLAGLLKDRSRFAEAEPLLEEALASLESGSRGDAEMAATARLNLAEVRRLQGRTAEAAPLYERALADARSALGPRHPDLVPFLNQAAVCAHALGQAARAESLYVEAGAVTVATLGEDHPLVAQSLHDLARLRLAAGRWREADSLLARALALRERLFGPAHPEAALTRVERAQALRHDPAGSAAALAHAERAIAILDSSRTYPEARLDAYAVRAELRAARGRRAEAIADLAVAVAAVESLRVWRGGGDAARVALVAGRLALYDRLIGWLIEAREFERALETHERARARALLDQILSGGVDLRADIAPAVLAPLAAAEEEAEARLAAAHRTIEAERAGAAGTGGASHGRRAALEARRDSAAFALAAARRRIEEASPLWRRVLSADGRVAGAAELRREVAARHGPLIVYHAGGAGVRVFLVPRRGAVEVFPLVVSAADAAALGVAAGALTEAGLERIMSGPEHPDSLPGFAALLGGRRAGGYLELAGRGLDGHDRLDLRLHALWRTLVPPPLWRRVCSTQRAVLIPDGALHGLAFEALATAPGRAGRPARYWLDEGPALRYAPSASTLLNLGRRPRGTAAGASVLTVSDVAYAGEPGGAGADTARTAAPRRWSRLPATAGESEAIRAAFGASRVTSLSGVAAREGDVRAALPRHRYLHLATHGYAEGSLRELRAGLVLAPPAADDPRPEDDGLLEMFEIHRLRLACDLAVLSACETARGPRIAGEGAFALSRAFLAAGANAVVASLWPVDDQAAATLVGRLFTTLAPGDRGEAADAAIALRDAKRAVRREPRWADPFSWAPFVFTGR